jgi:hypothetical protein
MKSPMHGTGIGYAGIDGVWWLPAERHFVWPRAMRDHLARVGDALFQFVDAVWRVLESGSDPELAAQLRHRVPESLTSHFDLAPVLSFRPDFQLVPTGEPALPFRPVLTEIEIAPSAQGFAHAMQVGYGLSTDIADSFAAFLDGRTFYIVGTAQWSEFLFEQLAFCRALAERGATAFVLYDRPLATLAAEIARGERWQPPIFGIPTRPPGWNVDLQARFQTHGFERFWLDQWPEQVDDGVVYRFGYLENFDAAHLARMDEWRANGATFINPLAYPLDSKVLLTALQRPTLRSHLSPTTLDLLDGAIPETHLLTPAILPILQQERAGWLIKYAGFDGGNAAWGGRSVGLGLDYDGAAWQDLLQCACDLPWPVVAQRLTPSAQMAVDYLQPDGSTATLYGSSRLRVFFLHTPGGSAIPCGAHITVSGGTRVSEGAGSVQGPIEFLKVNS